jgi:hypothetical protein
MAETASFWGILGPFTVPPPPPHLMAPIRRLDFLSSKCYIFWQREVDMKKILALSAFLFVCVSAAFAIHPLIGKWRFSYVIDGRRFYDYVTIKLVDTTTKRVAAYKTRYPSEKLTGYYNGNIVFIMNTGSSIPEYLDAYYFTFQGTTPMKKYLSITDYPDSVGPNYDVIWRGLVTTKLSSSMTSTETMSLSDILNQIALKKQALLRERMTAPT